MVENCLLLIAGIVGIQGMWRRTWPLTVSLVAFTIIHLAVASRMRYVLAVVPLLLALAAPGFIKIGKKARFLPIILPICIVLAIIFGALVATGKIHLPNST